MFKSGRQVDSSLAPTYQPISPSLCLCKMKHYQNLNCWAWECTKSDVVWRGQNSQGQAAASKLNMTVSRQLHCSGDNRNVALCSKRQGRMVTGSQFGKTQRPVDSTMDTHWIHAGVATHSNTMLQWQWLYNQCNNVHECHPKRPQATRGKLTCWVSCLHLGGGMDDGKELGGPLNCRSMSCFWWGVTQVFSWWHSSCILQWKSE